MSDYPHRFSSHDQYCKAIIRLVGSISGSYNTAVVFTDCCRCMQLSIASQVNTREHDRLEAEYMTYVEKYGKKGMLAMADVFSLVVECLDTYREDVLGHVLEALHATEKSFGQFFTPTSVSRMMSRITMANLQPDSHGLIKICDPAVGAGVNVIEAAESAIHEHHIAQRNIYVEGDDIDATACSICYVQLSLLGYAGVVRHMDTLSMKEFEAPLYTPGYFFHAFPMRFPHGVFFASENIVDRPVEKKIPPHPSPVENPSPVVVIDNPDQMMFNF